MLNNYSVNKNIVSTHINAISGGITKTYADSFFLRFHLQSPRADKLLCSDPVFTCKRKGDSWANNYPVKVLQMVICGDMEVMAELIFEDDFKRIMEGLDYEKR